MSLRAIQKRDREKLSSTQRQQQQFISGSGVGGTSTTMLLAPPPYQDGTTTTTTTTMRMTAGAVYAATSADAPIPSVQSIIQNQQNRQQLKHRNSTDSTTQRPSPSSSSPGSTRIRRRSSSFPALLPSRALELAVATGSRTTPLRSTQSEGDLRTVHDRRTSRGAKTGRGTGDSHGVGLHLAGGAGGVDSGSSTNNIYLGAKSEVCLKTLAVKNTLPYVVGSTSMAMQPARATEDRHSSRCTSITTTSSAAASTKPRLYESRRNSELLTAGSEFGANGKQPAPHPGNVRIPIVGYEVMEERARFTIFKLRIENSISHSCWLVLRRYTDFVRLNNKLKSLFPHCNLVLPRKKWFGDNFSSGFIDNRIQGLQTFINTILGDDAMRTCQAVRDFFCLDEPPPSYSESMEESRVIFEAQEERIAELRQQLQTKEDLVQALQTKLATEANRNKLLSSVLRNSTEKCAKCAKSIDQQMKESVYR
uniref:Putative the phosphoinositide binding phox similarity domain of sorting nexin 16 n=1 Tax=Anopheles triannulatus TaxID=58253 RepID=A0A2M4ABX1_9DIPT